MSGHIFLQLYNFYLERLYTDLTAYTFIFLIMVLYFFPSLMLDICNPLFFLIAYCY